MQIDVKRTCQEREKRAENIYKAGNLQSAVKKGWISPRTSLALSEALVIGLIQQGVRTYYSVLGHGSTELGEVLRIYEKHRLIKVYGLRSEVEASHAATALRWVTGQKAAVVTSIGPGALQALAGSLVPASNGIGVWYLFGNETTEDEGFNMQQIPAHHQASFLKMMSNMGETYDLYTPSAVTTCLARGTNTVDHPYRQGPFFVLMPMNTQTEMIEDFNLNELPYSIDLKISAAEGDYAEAARLIRQAKKVLVKVGGGGRCAGPELTEFVEKSGAVLVHTPIATGCIPYSNPANMGVGGSKGSICGNYAMENADLLVAVGTRAVCQSDSSRTGYPQVKQVISINADPEDATHYNRNLPFAGDAKLTLARLNQLLTLDQDDSEKAAWRKTCSEQKNKWQEFKDQRFAHPCLYDDYWKKTVLTQPAAIRVALHWAKKHGIPVFFDAGDVQANGFQTAEDEKTGQTFTDTGASYMGFAVSALLTTGTSSSPFYALAITGDGSFTMNPQILIDGAEYHARGCILLLDNGRMGAISGLQNDQYGVEFATSQSVQIDYLQWARGVPGVQALYGGTSVIDLENALEKAFQHNGLTMIHTPVYYGSDEMGGLGVYGRWNVGNWSKETQKRRHEIGL